MIKTLLSSLLIIAISSTAAYASDSNVDESPTSINPEAVAATVPETGEEKLAVSKELEYMNPVDPAFWAKVFDTNTHHQVHKAMLNPAQHLQMMDPQFYAQMMNPAVWMKWMNPESYTIFVNPVTWMSWMNPEAHMHSIDPETYSHLMQSDTWTHLFDEAVSQNFTNTLANTRANAEPNDSSSTNSSGGSFFNWFNMAAVPLVEQQADD